MPDADRRRWDARHRAGPRGGDPCRFLLDVADLIPRPKVAQPVRALDVAGGVGREALWLARLGLDVTLADISNVALDIAEERAERERLPLRLLDIDFELEPFPEGPFNVILSFNFLWRPLFDAFPRALAPGGLLVFAQPTRKNLERHPHPSAPFLLEEGELPGLVPALEVLRYEEGWFDDRHEARLVAQRPWLPPWPPRV